MLREQLIPEIHNTMRETLETEIQEIMAHKKNFVIWGAGNTGRETLQFITDYTNAKLVPQYIVDNNSSLWGTDNIKNPSELFADRNQIDVVLVCVYVADQVIQQLKDNGYTGKILPISMSLLSIDEDAIHFYEQNIEQLEKMYALLADEQSRQTVVTFLNVLRTADISLWNSINGESTVKLLDPEVMHFSHNEYFVDVGAFTGDTISKFLELCHGQYQSINGFEPDAKNFSAMKQYAETEQLTNVHLYNMAAGANDGTQHFLNDRSESCILSETDGDEISIVRLDSIDTVQNTTILKVSANGWDLGVLEGAKDIIQRNKPQISAYASRELLWKIPFYLKQLVPEYKIYYRHYGIGRQAMICYAIHPESTNL